MAGGCPDVLLPEDSSVLILVMAFKLAAAPELMDTVVIAASDGCFLSPSFLEGPTVFLGGGIGGRFGWKCAGCRANLPS